MKILTFDYETTTKNKGNPHDRSNWVVNVGWMVSGGPVSVAYHDDRVGLEEFQKALADADVICCFNSKFELHWSRRTFGYVVPDNVRVYDPQLAWFILTNQQNRYPSLNQVAAYFGLGQKIDVIKEDYWSKGIDTPDIPRDVLTEYLVQDVELTYQVYQCLQEAMPASKRKLVQLAMMDLLILQEMEWNGLLYDKEKSLELAKEERAALADIDKKLNDLIGMDFINWNSGDQLSAVLYGGTISKEEKEQYLFTYKDPKRQPAIKERKVKREYQLPRLVEPLPKSELAKEGLFATNEPTLRSLKAKGKAKDIITLVLERARKEKLVSSYYEGIPKLMDEMNWEPGILHHTLNQCNAVTGRLSSERPNAQNMSADVKKLLISRY